MKKEVDKVDMVFENIKSYCIRLILDSDLDDWSSKNPFYLHSVCLINNNIIISAFTEKRYNYYNVRIYKDNLVNEYSEDRKFDIYFYTIFKSKEDKARLLSNKRKEIVSHVLYKDKYNGMMNTLNLLPERVTRKSKLQNL